MKLKFSLHYRTEWGQSLHVVIAMFSGKRHLATRDLIMTTADGELWSLETSVMESRLRPVDSIEYNYQVEDSCGRMLRREWCEVKRKYAFDGTANYIFPDSWRDVPGCIHLYSHLYSVSKGLPEDDGLTPCRIPLFRKTLVFRVSAPQVGEGEALAICGSHPTIGRWNPAHFVRMKYIGQHEWMLSLNAGIMPFPLEYKFVVIDAKSNTLLRWEQGENRTTDGLKMDDGDVLVLHGGLLHESEPDWKIFGVRTAAPTPAFIKWAGSLGIHLIFIDGQQPFTTSTFRHLCQLADYARSLKVSLMTTVKVDLRRDLSIDRVRFRLRALEKALDAVSLEFRFPDDASLHPDYTAYLLRERLELIMSQTRMVVAQHHSSYPDSLKAVFPAFHVLPVMLHCQPHNEQWEFAHLSEYPYYSIAATSLSHTPSLSRWWSEDPGRAQRYNVTILHSKGHAPQNLTPAVAEAILARHAFSPSMICLAGMDDVEAMYEGHRKTMGMSTEELSHAVNLNEKLLSLLRESHRR